jgi:spore coat polysaccharide biosynthesis predicted glycosyltransferase SpsG
MQRRRRATVFLSHLDPLSLATSIHRAGNEWLAAEHPFGTPDDLVATVRTIRKLQPAAVVVVAPQVTTEYLDTIRGTGVMVVVLDSTAATALPVDLVVNPLMGVRRHDYQAPFGTQFLCGHKYALVRPLVRKMRPIRAQEPPQPFRALIALGDDDAGQALERAQQLLATSRIERVDVATRNFHPCWEELQALKESSNGRLEVVTEPGEISARIGRAHLALTAGDNWALEMACVGIPQLVLTQSERHVLNAQRLDDLGVGMFLGEAKTVTANALRQAVNHVLNHPEERSTMARCGRKLIDARGPDRFVNAVEILLHPAANKRAGVRLVA